jgi:hypothetical protein
MASCIRQLLCLYVTLEDACISLDKCSWLYFSFFVYGIIFIKSCKKTRCKSLIHSYVLLYKGSEAEIVLHVVIFICEHCV